MKFCIVLSSKYTGDAVHLGSAYQTREEAEAYIEKDVCKKCNYARVHTVPDDWHWHNRKIGFHPPRESQAA